MRTVPPTTVDLSPGEAARAREDAQRALATAELLLPPAAIDAALERMAAEATRLLAASNPIVMPVMLGGAFAALRMCAQFRFAYQLDRVQVARYGDDLAGGELRWIVEPQLSLAGRAVLVVDDILDQGITLAAVVRRLREAGAASVHSAVLVIKDVERRVAADVDIAGVHCADRYVFGCGMDYLGYWRGLPALYALRAAG